jgi:hypothetical protein
MLYVISMSHILASACTHLLHTLFHVQDYMKLDVLARMDAASAAGDQKLHAAWEAASQFKKRFMEYKGELDSIRIAAARMQVCSYPAGRNQVV